MTWRFWVAFAIFSVVAVATEGAVMVPVLLDDVHAVSGFAHQMTTGRRMAPQPQLQCVRGGTVGCEHIHLLPAAVQCSAVGKDDQRNTQWRCIAELNARVQFGRTDVSCEGYAYPDDPYILPGSCGIEYTLDYTPTPRLQQQEDAIFCACPPLHDRVNSPGCVCPVVRNAQRTGAAAEEAFEGWSLVWIVFPVLLLIVLGTVLLAMAVASGSCACCGDDDDDGGPGPHYYLADNYGQGYVNGHIAATVMSATYRPRQASVHEDDDNHRRHTTTTRVATGFGGTRKR